MPQIAPDFEELPEILQFADQLIDRYPEMFGGIELSRISAFAVTNKDRKDESKPIWEMMSVKPPLSIMCNKDYVIKIFLNSYEAMGEKHRVAMVADALNSISSDGQGKLNARDLKEYAVMVRTLGVDYMTNPDIPDLLNSDVDWVRK